MRKMLRKQTLVLVVIITALLSCLAVGITSAKYYSEFTGSGSTQVAKWYVNMESEATTMNFNGSDYNGEIEVMSYDFTITSNSEVAVNYVVNITFDKELPQNVRIWLDDEATCKDGYGNNSFEFSGYTYNIGDGAKEHRLYIEVTYMKDGQENLFNQFQSKVNINVTAEQKTPTR